VGFMPSKMYENLADAISEETATGLKRAAEKAKKEGLLR
jgi:hypothetical protein